MQSLPNPILAMIVREVPFSDAKRLLAIKTIGDVVFDVHFQKFVKLCFLVPLHLQRIETNMSISVEFSVRMCVSAAFSESKISTHVYDTCYGYDCAVVIQHF